MSRTIGVVALVMGLVVAAVPARAEIKVFLMAGQSNMVGAGYTYQLKAPYNATQPDVKIWNYTGSWISLSPSYEGTIDSDRDGRFGPEVTFGYTINNLFPNDDIYLVKYAVNGTTLSYDWDPNRTDGLYNTLKTRVTAALGNLTSTGHTYTIAGMLWMQGETDAKDYSAANAYQANLEEFITKVRTDFSASDMKFVIGRISPPWATYTGKVRAAQEAVAAKMTNVSWFNTDDLPIMSATQPNYHYSSAGQVELGIRFANQFAVPEPSMFVLIGTGLVVLAVASYAWRKRRLPAA
jgi:hypothetical protein